MVLTWRGYKNRVAAITKTYLKKYKKGITVHRMVFMNALQGYGGEPYVLGFPLPPKTYYGYLGNMVVSYHFIQIVVGRNIQAYVLT